MSGEADAGVRRGPQAGRRGPRSGVSRSGYQTPAQPQICQPAPFAHRSIEPGQCDQLLVYLVDSGNPRSSWNVGGPQINA